jgi:Domain of unknown function (DUF4062)
MPRYEQILSVFVASPSDVCDERARLEEVITELNQSWSRSLCIRVDLIRWETHAYPGFGADAQEVINRQIPNDCDIFIGVMWCRFGTTTGRAESGTEEEFMRAKSRWDNDNSSIDMMIYFKNGPISPSQIDASQLSKVNEFRKSLGEEGGLYWQFESTDDFANLMRVHLTRVVQVWRDKIPDAVGALPMKPKINDPSLATNPESGEDEEPGLFQGSHRCCDADSEGHGDHWKEDGRAYTTCPVCREYRARNSCGSQTDDLQGR